VLKKRLIFTLLVNAGKFQLSRNFKLQSVGDFAWIRANYEFDAIAFSIDELVVLDVTRGQRDSAAFAALLQDIARYCFMPIAAGGGVRSVDDARRLLNSGADKVVVNTPIFRQPALIEELSARFGAQCVIGSVDYKRVGTDEAVVFTENGADPVDLSLVSAVERAEALGAGELYLTSMTRDGTGQGLDVTYVSHIARHTTLPVIISGGAGNFIQLSEAISDPAISAVSTANLFNFMGDNLREARSEIIASGTPLATWKANDVEARW
jgi:imidazole glycerol-phosphate synthase subunit HisF